MRATFRLLATASATALVLAACGTDTADEPTADEPTTEPTEDTEPTDEPDDGMAEDTTEDETAGEDTTDGTDDGADDDGADDGAADDGADLAGVELLTLTESSHGEHLGDRDGLTVYAFVEDTDGQPTCMADCAVVWSPVAAPADGPEVGEGVDAELAGTVEREDASVVGVSHQLTYAGQPLYTFTADQEPGDARGQELAASWFVVGTDGELIGDVPADAGSEDADDGDDGEDGEDGDE